MGRRLGAAMLLVTSSGDAQVLGQIRVGTSQLWACWPKRWPPAWGADNTLSRALAKRDAVPTGSKGIGNAKPDCSHNAIYSADTGSDHVCLNLVTKTSGTPDPGLARLQTLWAVVLSRSINARWGLVVEFSGTQQGGASTAQFLVVSSVGVSKNADFRHLGRAQCPLAHHRMVGVHRPYRARPRM